MKYIFPLALLTLTLSSCDSEAKKIKNQVSALKKRVAELEYLVEELDKGISSNSTVASEQGALIKWEDGVGREFSIQAPTGEFSYQMLDGDHINYNRNGSVSSVGGVYISYNRNGSVSSVGGVYISYNRNGSVSSVGGLYISYDRGGRVSRTSGSVK